MKEILIKLIFPGILLFSLNKEAQTNAWRTEKSNDGKIIVKSNVSEQVDAFGKTYPVVEYLAITTDFMTMANCINVMENVSRHKEFLDLKINEKIKSISENEWLNYYIFNAPWPFSPTDCIVKVVHSENLKTKTEVFEYTAEPNLMKATSLKRFTNYNYTYTFRELGNGKVELTVSAKMMLTVNVPLWMLRSSFPGSAADPVQKLVRIIKEK
jgi:hypothetical protein